MARLMVRWPAMARSQVRRIVGDMYVSVDEDRLIRETYQKLYGEIMSTIDSPNSRHAMLMPQVIA